MGLSGFSVTDIWRFLPSENFNMDAL